MILSASANTKGSPMNEDTALRIAHAILNGAKHKDIASTQGCSMTDVTAAWKSVAERVKNPPGDYHNMREVMVFKDDWRRLIMALG